MAIFLKRTSPFRYSDCTTVVSASALAFSSRGTRGKSKNPSNLGNILREETV